MDIPVELKATVQNTPSQRPIVSLFNVIRDRIRNRFSSKGNNSVSTTSTLVPSTSTNPTPMSQEESSTTELTQQPQNVAIEILETISVSTFPNKASELTINSDIDNEGSSSFSESDPVESIAETTKCCKCEELSIEVSENVAEILNGVRINTENISSFNSSLIEFQEIFGEKLNEISEVLKNLNDQVAINNEISQFCFKDQNAKKKARPATQSNIIQLDILKP